MRLNHPEHEHRFLPIIRHKTLGDACVLWLRHDLHHFFVTDEKRKRRTIAFCQKRRQRDNGPNLFPVFQCAMQRPHLLVGFVRVQAAAVCRGDNERQRIAASGAIYEFQAVAQFLFWLEIIEKARVGVHLHQAESQSNAQQNDA